LTVSQLGKSEIPIDGRLRLVGAFIVAVFVVFVLRLFQLQIIEGEILRTRSEQNSVRTIRLKAPRGDILDREGRVLATTRPAYELQVIPSGLGERKATFAVLAQLLDGDAALLEDRVGVRKGPERFQPVTLVDDLDFDRLAKVETHRYALPGVVTDVQPRRHYVEGTMAAHLMGLIGEIDREQLEKRAREGYRPGDVIGQAGLEARLESHLRGRAGGRNVVVDVAGREVEVLEEVAAVPGGKVVLTLDLDLQRVAEAAFLDVPDGEPARIGAAVAMDVRTGEVLVMLSLPSYDPNAFAGGIDVESWNALTEDEWKPLQNRAIQNHYPPGSTHKPILAAALLADGIVTTETRVFCPGYFRHGRRTYHCWKRRGHGNVDLRKALKESCDVYFYTQGVKLGIDRLAHYARAFGLGHRTGIRLASEVTGLIPSREWKKRRFGVVWYPGETVSASIGQGYNLYTPLQLAVAYAALANGGKVLQPRLLKRLEAQDGTVVEEFSPKINAEVPISPEHLAVVRRGLAAAVQEPGGTGYRARLPGIEVAGKTGTAQVVRLEHTEGMEEEEIPIRYRDHGWFGAFAPVEAPEIAVGVFVEHGLHGSTAAAPIAQRILARYFEKKAEIREAVQVTESGLGGDVALD
jgi:penicillin-binding protein 2